MLVISPIVSSFRFLNIVRAMGLEGCQEDCGEIWEAESWAYLFSSGESLSSRSLTSDRMLFTWSPKMTSLAISHFKTGVASSASCAFTSELVCILISGAVSVFLKPPAAPVEQGSTAARDLPLYRKTVIRVS